MISEIKIVKKENVYTGFNPIDKYSFQITFLSGKKSPSFSREVSRRLDAVAVLIYNSEKKHFVFVRQFRAGSFVKEQMNSSLEIVAGLIEENCSLEKIAYKEVKEETSLKINSLKPIFSFYPEISSSSRQMFLFYAETSNKISCRLNGCVDENEFTWCETLSVKKAKDMLLAGKFENSHTLIALSWFFLKNPDII